MRMLVLILLVVPAVAAATDVDTLVFANGNTILGEIQSMERGVLKIETDYSDSDFQIEWTEVVRIETATHFEISLSDTDRRYYGWLSSSADSQVTILTLDGRRVETSIANIVYLGSFESGFWERVFASIDVGFSLTKAQNLRQFTSRSTVGAELRGD